MKSWITSALISFTVTQREMSCRHRWYLCFLHGMIYSLIQLSCPRFEKKLSRSSPNTPSDNKCLNRNHSKSKSNDLSSPVIPVPPILNDSIVNPPQLSYFWQQSSSSSQNTKHELQASSIPGRTSPDPSNAMPPPSTNNVSCNIYGCMIDLSKLTPAKRQHHAVMLLQHYHELCNTNDPSSMFISPPTITNIEALSQSTISSLESG